jgi:hypothetical protein
MTPVFQATVPFRVLRVAAGLGAVPDERRRDASQRRSSISGTRTPATTLSLSGGKSDHV